MRLNPCQVGMSGKRRSYFHNFYSNPGTAEDMPAMRGLRFGQSARQMRNSPAFSEYELGVHSGICFAGWKFGTIRRKSCSPCADCVSGSARAKCAIHPHFQNMNLVCTQESVLRAENPTPSGENHAHHARIACRAERTPNARFTCIFRV